MTIGDIAEVNPGLDYPIGLTDSDPVSFVPMAAVSEHSPMISDAQTRPISEVWKGHTRFKDGDVLFAKITPSMENGKAAIARNLCNGIGLGSTEFHVLRPHGWVLSEWLYYYVHQSAFRSLAAAQMKGTAGQLRVPSSFIIAAAIPVPPIVHQRRIVDVIEAEFSRLDVAVATLERAQANLERYKAAVLQAACEGRLVPTEAELAREEGRDYEPAEVLLERILAERRRKWEEARWAELVERAKKKAAQAERKAAGLPYYLRELPEASWVDRPEEEYAPYLPKGDKWKAKYEEPEPPDTEDLPELPEGWVWATVEQLGQVIGGLTKNSRRDEYSAKFPYLRVANVYADELRLKEIEEIGVRQAELDRVLLEAGDLLVVEGNGSIDQIGRVAIWDGSIAPCVHQNHIIKVRLLEPTMGRYVLSWLLSTGGREQIVRVASSTSGLYTLSLSKVSVLPVPLPPRAEQDRIAIEADRLLSIADVALNETHRNQSRADRLRQAILKRAFEGRLVPQDPDDEWVSSDCEAARADPHNADVVQDRLPGM